MAEFTVERPDLFPPGTVVGAYPAGGSGQSPPGPPPSLLAGQETVNPDGTLPPFENLDEDRLYWAAAQVGGLWRYTLFAIDPPSPVRTPSVARDGSFLVVVGMVTPVDVLPEFAGRNLGEFTNYHLTAILWTAKGEDAVAGHGTPVFPMRSFETSFSDRISVISDTAATPAPGSDY